MKGYKEVIIPIREDMKFLSIDSDGTRWLSSKEPIYLGGRWSDADFHPFDVVPKPKDASKELYRI